MVDLKAFVGAMFGDQTTNWVILLLLLLPALDWILGILRAIQSKTFQLDLIDVFLRTTVAGRVIPLLLLILFGRFVAVGAPTDLVVPGLDLNVLTTAGYIAAVPFILATINSIYGSVNLKATDEPPLRL